MEIIQSSIKCFHCKKTLEAPVLLPCGESICQSHTNDFELGTDMPCGACGQTHTVPTGGFVRQRGLEKIIKTQIERINLGSEHDEALKSCRELDHLLGEIGLLRNDPNYFVNESIAEIRRDVELKREKLKMKIDAEADRIVGELDAYEASCKDQWASSGFFESLGELEVSTRETRAKLELWFDEFNKIDFNEQKWRTIKQESERMTTSIESRLNALKQILLLNKLPEYRIKPVEFNEIDINSKKMRSKILSIAQKIELMNLCGFSHEQEWRLLYRASEDGFGASKFHTKCDSKCQTLAIIKSSGGWIFGGYTDAIWDQSNSYKTDANAFIFSLTNRENQPLRMSIISGKESLAVHGSAVSGIRFGGGSDLIIADNSFNNTNSFSNLGHTYKHPTYAHGSNEAKCFLAGSYNFQVFEIEIYQRFN